MDFKTYILSPVVLVCSFGENFRFQGVIVTLNRYLDENWAFFLGFTYSAAQVICFSGELCPVFIFSRSRNDPVHVLLYSA